MDVGSRCSFGRGKTLTFADRSISVGVQELLPASNSFAFHGRAALLHE